MVRSHFAAGPILLFAICFLLSTSCTRQPEVVVWDFRKGQKSSDIGWRPKNQRDVGFHKSGDIDFTYINSRGQTFRERCSSIGAMRDVQRDEINYVYAHFRTAIPFDEAEPLIRKTLTDWSGGLNDRTYTGAYPFFDDFVRAVREGTWDISEPRFGGAHVVRGKDTGRVRITFHDNPAASKGVPK